MTRTDPTFPPSLLLPAPPLRSRPAALRPSALGPLAPLALLALMIAGLWLALAALPAAAQIQSRLLHQSFPTPPGALLRLANLAGRLELVRGTGPEVVVDATIHAEGSGPAETGTLLSGMQWVRSHDVKGREEWALSYGVEKYHSFHYPGISDDSSGFWSFLVGGYSSTVYRGVKVRIYSQRRSSAPTLYADLRVSLPPGGAVAVRNQVGTVRGGELDGTLEVDTGSGDVHLDSFAGHLSLDTGSGDIHLGTVRGESEVDTGSGDVVVRQLVGNSKIDTGSGDVRVERAAVGKLVIDTGSGSATVAGGEAGEVSINTGSGDVELRGLQPQELLVETGSGAVTLQAPLERARKLVIKTGSGDVHISAGQAASFDLSADQGSGDLSVEYTDASLRRVRNKLVGARRGDGRTAIRVETGSGDCVIGPHTGD